MSTSNSKRAYFENTIKFANDQDEVEYYIKNNSQITGRELEQPQFMNAPYNTFSGRITNLKKEGKVYVIEGKGKHSKLVWEADVEKRKDLARPFINKLIKSKMVTLATELQAHGYATQEELEPLRVIYRRILNDRTVIETNDMMTAWITEDSPPVQE